MPLPFLVLHGEGLWKVLLVAIVAIVLGTTLLLRKLGARTSAKLATRTLDRDPSEGIVRGTLGGGTIATLALTTKLPNTGTTLRHRDGELWIETPDGRIALVGEIQALSGSRTSATRNGVPKRTPAPLRDNPLVHPPRLRRRKITIGTLVELAPGDLVVARGALVRAAGTEATDYRENATAVSLHATDTPIQIVAQQPRSAVARPSVIAFALLAGFSGFIGYKIEAALGDSWRDACYSPRLSEDGPSHIVIDNTQACVLANTMPDQDDALERLSDRFDRTPMTNEADVEEHLALARLAGGCASSLDHARRVARPEILLAEAERCHDFGDQQFALIELGRFEEAARLGMIDRNPGALFVLGGNWTAAADLADSNATHVTRDPEMTADRYDSIVLQWRCIAELMRWDAGDRAALDRLRALSPGPNPACRVELVEMTSGAERDALLLDGASDEALRAAFEPLFGAGELRSFALQQALAGQPTLMQDNIGSTLADGSAQMSMLWSPMVWAAASAPAPRDGASANFKSAGEGQFAYYEGRIVAHVDDGDLAAAHVDADRAIAIANSLGHDYIYSRRDLGVLHALIDLYGPVTTTPYTDASAENTADNELLGYELPHIYLRHGEKKLDKHQWLQTDIHALLAASDGDGEPLAIEMMQPFRSWTNMDVLSVLPRIKTHRDEVMQIVKWGPASGSRLPYDFPWGLIANTAERRTMFELVGDHDEAARWAAIYARYRKAFTDRKTLIALTLWTP